DGAVGGEGDGHAASAAAAPLLAPRRVVPDREAGGRARGIVAPLGAGAGEPEDLGPRWGRPGQRAERERQVGPQASLDPQLVARPREARPLAHDEREVRVGRGQAGEALARPSAAEPDALRELDHPRAAEVAEHRLAHRLLTARVEVAEVAAALEQDRAALADRARERRA